NFFPQLFLRRIYHRPLIRSVLFRHDDAAAGTRPSHGPHISLRSTKKNSADWFCTSSSSCVSCSYSSFSCRRWRCIGWLGRRSLGKIRVPHVGLGVTPRQAFLGSLSGPIPN